MEPVRLSVDRFMVLARADPDSSGIQGEPNTVSLFIPTLRLDLT